MVNFNNFLEDRAPLIGFGGTFLVIVVGGILIDFFN